MGAGWINEQEELEEREYNSRDDVDLFGGEYHFTVSFNEWFLELVSETLGDLEEIAEKNAEKQELYQHTLTQWQMDSINLNSPRNKNKHPILVKFFAESKEFVNVTDLANAADKVGKAMTPPVAVTRVSVSRIYNQAWIRRSSNTCGCCERRQRNSTLHPRRSLHAEAREEATVVTVLFRSHPYINVHPKE